VEDYINNHSKLDKFLHNLVFKPWYPRVNLSNIESAVFKKQLSTIAVEKPVFITALPRAGTTLLLRLCAETQEFASHTYRDMPFLMTPLLWGQFSNNFRHSTPLKERVHGDGILVNVNSPESFEEIIWKEFWDDHYQKNKIIPWGDEINPEFKDFFNEHMRKIILIRGNGTQNLRYLSKNNLNIARINYLSTTFPDSKIIILFRSPLQHASSLLKQHQNFLKIHQMDPFAKKYMADTGHFDFGANLRPVNFRDWLSNNRSYDTNALSFWLHYWINTYKTLLNQSTEQVFFVSFDALCEEPKRSLENLSAILEMQNPEKLVKNYHHIKTPVQYKIDANNLNQIVVAQANDILNQLQDPKGNQ